MRRAHSKLKIPLSSTFFVETLRWFHFPCYHWKNHYVANKTCETRNTILTSQLLPYKLSHICSNPAGYTLQDSPPYWSCFATKGYQAKSRTIYERFRILPFISSPFGNKNILRQTTPTSSRTVSLERQTLCVYLWNMCVRCCSIFVISSSSASVPAMTASELLGIFSSTATAWQRYRWDKLWLKTAWLLALKKNYTLFYFQDTFLGTKQKRVGAVGVAKMTKLCTLRGN